MYRTLMIAVAVLTFISDLAYKASLALQEVDANLDRAAEDLHEKAADLRYQSADNALYAAYDAVERAEERLKQQQEAHRAELLAIEAAHG